MMSGPYILKTTYPFSIVGKTLNFQALSKVSKSNPSQTIDMSIWSKSIQVSHSQETPHIQQKFVIFYEV